MKKTCFVICPIGEPGSETRKRSDDVYKHVIKNTLEKTEYTLTRADEYSVSGKITEQIFSLLLSADLVIADMTGNNPNVLYELGIRHAIRKPAILLMQKQEIEDKKTAFDVKDLRAIPIDPIDINVINAAKAEIKKQISSISESTPPIEYH